MEVYVLDDQLRRDTVVDVFDSLIWTERFQKEGDFELNVNATADNLSLFETGTRLALTESKRVMEVETLENSISSEGQKSLKVTGRSIEKCLYDRVAAASATALATSGTWKLSGTPGALMRKIFHDICITGVLNSKDKLTMAVEGSIMPASTITESTTVVNIDLDIMTVGDALIQIGEQYDLGFRLLRNADAPQLWFDVYSGSDRTTSQSSLPAVIFSPDLDNLQDTKGLTSNAAYKNTAYVFSPAGFKIVYADKIDPTIAGFERRILFVKADNITDAATADAQMTQVGLEELSKNRMISAFDGEITQHSSYKYGVDYQLGDLIELRNNVDGATNVMRVTEQIFVSDTEGDKSYPTLSKNQFITPGSWLGWDSNQTWLDLNSNMMTWAEQP